MKMRLHHYFLLACFIFGISAALKAQPTVHLGFKAGGLRSTVMTDEQDIPPTERIESPPLRPSGKMRCLIGASAFIEKEEVIGNFYFQPELFFNKSSGEIRLITDPGTDTESVEKREEIYKRLDLPLIWGYRFLFLQVYVGPVVSYMLSTESELDARPDFDRQFKDFSVGYKIGIGLNDKRKYIDIMSIYTK